MKRKTRYITVDKIFGESFNLYFKNIMTLSIPSVVVFFLFGIFFLQYYNFLSDMSNRETFNTTGIIAYLIVMMVISLLFYFLYYMEISLASNAYTDRESQFKDILAESLKRFFPFLGLNILFGLGAGLGGLLFIIPGYIIMLGWCVAHVVFVVEKEKALKSLPRSWGLTKGSKGKIFLIFLLIIAALYFAMLVITLLTMGIAAGFQGGFSKLQSPEFLENGTWLFMAVIMILYSFLFPLYAVFITVIYYNLKKEKEGFETELIADSFMESDSGEVLS